METKKCLSCGRTVLAVSKTCKHCGQSFDEDETFQDEMIEPKSEELPANTPPIIAEQQEPVVQQNSNIAELIEANGEEKKQWRVWIIIAGIFLVGLSVYWISKTYEQSGSSATDAESKSELFSSDTESQVTEDSSSTIEKADPSTAFVRTIVSKTRFKEQESFMVTFRFYTTLDAVAVDKIVFPEFDGFIVKDIPLSGNHQMQLEQYNDRNYYSLDIKQMKLSPQRSGRITIPSGRVEVVFRVKSGKKMQGSASQFDVMTNSKKIMTTNPLTIDVASAN